MRTRATLWLTESRAVLNEILALADTIGGRPVAAAIVDDRGETICFAAQAGVNVALARQNAFKKAYTSACMRVDGLAFEERLKASNQTPSGFGNANFIAGGGGAVVISMDGVILGGLGVSGRTSEEDEEIVQAGKQRMTELLAG